MANDNLKIRNFLFISFIIHLFIIAAVWFIPTRTDKRHKIYTASIVTSDEIKRPKQVLPSVRIKPVKPLQLPRVRPHEPVRQYKRLPNLPEKPAVPGRDKEDGRPLPEGIYPQPEKDKNITEPLSARKHEMPNHSDRSGLIEKEKLFDRGIISETARKGSELHAKKDEAITFDTKDYRYSGYMSRLKERIESIWVYPTEAARKGIYGDLKIRFTINKNGRLKSIELVRTSGYKMLDDAAIKALKDGEPYWPLPDEWKMDSYTILGHFIYSMYGYTIR